MLGAQRKDYNDAGKMQVSCQEELDELQDNMAGQIARTIARQSVKSLFVRPPSHKPGNQQIPDS
eukprot:3862979-Rhodomonas_salina.1